MNEIAFEWPKNIEKKNSFFQKRSWETVENNGGLWKKQPKRTENEPKTKLSKLLKTNEGAKNEAKTNRKTKLPKLLKIKDRKKTKRKTKLNEPALRLYTTGPPAGPEF